MYARKKCGEAILSKLASVTNLRPFSAAFLSMATSPGSSATNKRLKGQKTYCKLPFLFLLFICSTSCVIKFLMLFNLSLKLKKLTMWCKLLNMCRQFKVENLGGSNLNLKYQDGIQRSMWNIHYLELHIEDPEFRINQSIFYFRK